MTERVLLIGLDGGTFTTLDPLMDQGIMPFLKEFVAAGVRRSAALGHPAADASRVDLFGHRSHAWQSWSYGLLPVRVLWNPLSPTGGLS